jgi:hypothetical protein
VEREIEETAMSLILELPKDIEAALAFQARAAHMPTEQYLAKMVERAVENRRRAAAEQLSHHLGVMAGYVAPDTTTEQMEAAFDDALAAARPQRGW